MLHPILRPILQPILSPVLGARPRGGAPVVLKHIIIMGQSNGVAGGALPELTTSDSPALMFNAGTKPGGTGLTSLVPLVETAGETIAGGMTAWLNEQTGGKYLVSNVAVNGADYNSIKKGTTPYNDALAQVTAAKALAAAYAGYEVMAVCLIHGEQNQLANTTTYAANVATLQSDFQTDAQAISEQAGDIPLFACQQDGYAPSQADTQPGNGTDGSSTAHQLLSAAVANPGLVHIVGPRHVIANVLQDQLHKSNHGLRRLGEMYGKAIHEAVNGAGWTGLVPSNVSIVGAVITVTFDVPVAPLVFDYSMVLNPGVGKGFEYWDDSGAIPAISSVALNGTTAVDITLASPPSGFTYRQIRYAHTPRSSNRSGSYVGARGCLRDSDSAASSYGYPLYNHCPHFVRTF